MRSVSEKIDERILRLLGLEDVFDLDYDTYLTLLKEAIVTGAKKLPQEELALLANERKRIRGKKGRFKPKKDKITADKVATTKLLKLVKKKPALPPAPTTSPEEGAGGGFVGIRKTLDSILSTLGSKFKFDQKQADQDRKEKETEKRGKREASLEGFKKGVAGIVATTKKMLDPFQAIIDRIWKFIFFTLLGRAFTKFMEWMSDKGNQEKFNSFIEFLTDHWPALAGLYILFGTSFGKLVRGLLKGATRMIVALVANSGKIKNFISKNKKLAFLGLAIAPLATRELGNLLGENKETPESGLIPTKNPDLDQAKQDVDKAANTKVPTLNFGGMEVPTLNFGGMVPKFNLGGMLPTFAMGGMDFSGGVPITGAGQDDTLIAAKTGEAILTEKDQQDIGQRYVDRNTGQPLNIPQYLSGRKPGSVAMDNLRFPGFGGGFFNGGMISKFNNGGIVGGKPKIEDVTRQAHNSTVRIETAGSPGSGVLVKNNKGEYTILSAGHVISGSNIGEEISIITPDGKSHNLIRDEKNSQIFGDNDMGVLKFKSKENYMLARPGDPTKLKPGDTTYVGGYPINSKTGMQEFRFTTGKSIIPKYSYEGDSENLGDVKSGYTMAYDNPTQVGMSGGIVFNANGELIGIHGRGSGEGVRQGSRAIPISHYPEGFAGGGLIGGLDSFGRSVFENVGGSVGKTRGRETGLPGGGWFGEKLGEKKGRNIYEQLTNPLRRQGGGEVPQGPFTSLPSVGYVRPQGSFIPKPTLKGLPGPMPGSTLPFGWNPFRGLQGGGPVKENTGMDIPGATADRQLTMLQPGEYVLPVDTVNRLGVPVIDRIVAMTDSNSNPYLGRGTVRRPQITPYKTSSSNGGMMTLPPITQSAGGGRARSAGLGGGSEVPDFSAIAPGNERATNASIYGLAG